MGLLPMNVVTSKRVHVTRVIVCSIAFKHDVTTYPSRQHHMLNGQFVCGATDGMRANSHVVLRVS
jgi:hypothetical protein